MTDIPSPRRLGILPFAGRRRSNPRAGADRRKWVVVAAATVGMMAAFGLATTIAVFMKAFETEFGWMRADISFAYSLFSTGAALGGLIAGYVLDRLDTRPIAVFGAAVMAAGLIVLSWQSDLVTIQQIYLFTGIFGFACLYTPLLATVGLWFDRGRGLAIGIVTAGGTLGQGITPLVAQPLIDAMGWRHAYLALGIAYVLVLVPAMMFMTKPPQRNDATPAAGSSGSASWPLPPMASVAWIGAAAIFCCIGMAIPVVHLVTLLSDRGWAPAIVGSVTLTAMLSASVGRIAIGMIADRIGAIRSYVLAVSIQSVTVYWFVSLDALPAIYVLAVVFGFGYGGIMTSLILCVREAVPAKVAGVSTAVVGFLAWGGMAIGGYQGGYCFDATGSYAVSFASAALAGGVNLSIVAGLVLHMRWHRRLAEMGETVMARLSIGPAMARPVAMKSALRREVPASPVR